MRAVSVTEVARSLSEYLNRVAFRGERFILIRGNKEIAELRPYRHGVPLRDLAAGLAAGPQLTEADAESFGRDVEDARRRAAALPVGNPWATS